MIKHFYNHGNLLEYGQKIMKFIKSIVSDKLLLISFLVTLLTFSIGHPHSKDIDWQTIGSLFMLMVAVQTLQFLGIFKYLAFSLTKKVHNVRLLVGIIVLIAFLSSMLVTNDVSIITLIPLLALSISKTEIDPIFPVVLVCIASNLGSLLTPMGNPQNLFLFIHYNLKIKNFLLMGLPLSLFSLVLLEAMCCIIKPQKIQRLTINMCSLNKKQLVMAIGGVIVALLSILKFISLLLGMVISVCIACLISKKILKNIDYSILLTFICFFISISNISNLNFLVQLLKQTGNNNYHIYFISIFLSQFLSNVPTTFLLAPFTNHYYALFLGSNVGGLGTIIASLANVLAFKQYLLNFSKNGGSYLIKFTIINFAVLLIIILFSIFLIFLKS